MARTEETGGESPSRLIDERIASLGDWRGETLARLRKLIHEADPQVVETVKWRKPTNPAGVPVWEHGGILCTGETYKTYVKLTFMQGSKLPDPTGLFNASLNGVRRAIDIRDGGDDRRRSLQGAGAGGGGGECGWLDSIFATAAIGQRIQATRHVARVEKVE